MAKVAVTLGKGFEDSEYTVPVEKLAKAGHALVVVGVEAGVELEGKKGTAFVTVDKTPSEVRVSDFDALLVPGGHSPDALRIHPEIVELVRGFFEANKLVAAICHGPQLLIEAGVVEGRTLTSWPSVKTDLINAGAHWVDREVVEDGNLVTSRKPADLEAFTKAILNRLGDRRRARPQAPRAAH